MKKCQKVRKSAKNYETILPFSCCPLVFQRMSAGISGPELPLWADFSFLIQGTRQAAEGAGSGLLRLFPAGTGSGLLRFPASSFKRPLMHHQNVPLKNAPFGPVLF